MADVDPERSPLSTRGRARIRAVIAVTVATSAGTLLRGQLAWLREQGMDITLVCAPGESLQAIEAAEGVNVAPIPMTREVTPGRDLISLMRLIRLMLRIRPTLVNASTPKAGLLVTLVSWLTRVPIRVYTLRGLRLETVNSHSALYRLLWMMEWLTCRFATVVVCVSPSLRLRAIALGVVSPTRCVVLGAGSSNGVDLDRFRPARHEAERLQLRQSLGLSDDIPIIGFVGRLTEDKGITDLITLFERLTKRGNVHLVLVGDVESNNPLPEQTMKTIAKRADIAVTGWVSDPSPYFRIFDLLVFPSRREGFSNAVLEAAASGVPAVATRATGTVDAVQHGVTGLIVDTTPEAIETAIVGLLADDDRRQQMGVAARRRAEREFSRERVWRLLADFLHEQVAAASQPVYSVRNNERPDGRSRSYSAPEAARMKRRPDPWVAPAAPSRHHHSRAVAQKRLSD